MYVSYWLNLAQLLCKKWVPRPRGSLKLYISKEFHLVWSSSSETGNWSPFGGCYAPKEPFTKMSFTDSSGLRKLVTLSFLRFSGRGKALSLPWPCALDVHVKGFGLSQGHIWKFLTLQGILHSLVKPFSGPPWYPCHLFADLWQIRTLGILLRSFASFLSGSFDNSVISSLKSLSNALESILYNLPD